MQVVADEWRLTPSHSRVKPGTVKIEVADMGEDDHDFLIAGTGGGFRYDSDVVPPGGADSSHGHGEAWHLQAVVLAGGSQGSGDEVAVEGKALGRLAAHRRVRQ